jgi:hypothetical protein
LQAGDDGKSPRDDYEPHAGSNTGGIVEQHRAKTGMSPGLGDAAGANVNAFWTRAYSHFTGWLEARKMAQAPVRFA